LEGREDRREKEDETQGGNDESDVVLTFSSSTSVLHAIVEPVDEK
jgi:hypothetical protein